MTIRTKILKKLHKENIFVDIFTDLFTSSYYGYIRKFNDDLLLLEHYNDDGLYNGIVVFRTADITRIKWDNNDINSTCKTINKHNQGKKILAIKIDSLEIALKSIDGLYNHITVSIQHLDNGMVIIGTIKEMDKETILIHEYGTRSSLDRGMLMLSINDITRIDAGGTYENGLMKVHQKKK
ncbi:MAG: hypothetical protein ABIQ40_02935 [Bacteroidia bacterium]